MRSVYSVVVASTLLALLAVPQPSNALANGFEQQAQHKHAFGSNRMIKKRQGPLIPGRQTTTATSAAPADPTTAETTTTPAAQATTSQASASTPAASVSSSSTGGILDPVISPSASTTSATSAVSSASSSIPSTSSVTTQSQAPPTSASNPVVTPPPSASGTATRPPGSTIKITSSVTPSETATAEEKEQMNKSSQFGKNTIIAIAVIASCIGGAAAIWTLIRKWKLSPSSKFERRMNPIEWTPPSGEKDGPSSGLGAPGAPIAGAHQRANSTGSRHSGKSDQDSVGRNVTGNGNMFADQDPNQVVPPHDFTAGATANNQYDYNAGYVDLQRGNSTHLGTGAALTRGASVNHGAYDYDYPAHNQAAYDQAAYDPHGQYDYDNQHYANGAYGQQAGSTDLHRGPSMNRGQDAYAQDAYPADAYGAYPATQYPISHDPYAQYDSQAYGQGGYPQQQQQGRY